MKVLITGATGFVGSHMAEYLSWQSGIKIYGTKRRRSPLDNLCVPHPLAGWHGTSVPFLSVEARQAIPEALVVGPTPPPGPTHPPSLLPIELIDCELTDPYAVRVLIDAVRPDCIYHFAAQSYVPESWRSPQHTFEVNVLATLNILEAVRTISPDTGVLVAGTSEEYGFVLPDECPITETHLLRPQSPYGVSKVAMDLLCQQYVKSYQMHIVITRAFNHTGPRRGEVFATSNFAKQIAEIEAGKHEPIIRHGNLDAQRDFTDVRDMVRAYELALSNCEYGTPYNIGSGKAVSIATVLDTLLAFSDLQVKKELDPERCRPSDVPLLQADCTKLKEATGWEPKIPFSTTMLDLLNYWRDRCR